MFQWDKISQDTRQSITGIIWFIISIPLAMAMHFFAKFYEIMGFTIMGWFITVLGATQLGWAMKNKRLYSIPISIKHPLKKIIG